MKYCKNTWLIENLFFGRSVFLISVEKYSKMSLISAHVLKVMAASGKRGVVPTHLSGTVTEVKGYKPKVWMWENAEGKMLYYQESEEGSESYHTKHSSDDGYKEGKGKQYLSSKNHTINLILTRS